MRSDTVHTIRPQMLNLVDRLRKPIIIYKAIYKDGRLAYAGWGVLTRPNRLPTKKALLWAKAEQFAKQLNSNLPTTGAPQHES